jgi:hypothetical protein
MNVALRSVKGTVVTLEVQVDLTGSMLEAEDAILQAMNDVGSLATGEALKRFDTDGDPIVVGGTKWYSKGQVPKRYQTPYGEVEVSRHLYQRAQGGETFCPMERDARIVVTSTPRFAKMVSHKFARGASSAVREDLMENHGRVVARSYLQNLAEAVGTVVEAKEESWRYEVPKLDEAVHSIAIGLDGTCMLLCEEGYREAMTGTISLYDGKGERLHTVYLGASPEYGKGKFFERLEREIAHIKVLYPNAHYLGVADGARCNWDFIAPHVTLQILDFYHASGYLGQVAKVAYPRNAKARKIWLDTACHELKHTPGAVNTLLSEMEILTQRTMPKNLRSELDAAITFFTNHQHQMQYADYIAQHFTIGSGVTEAACKTLIKQRMCLSGAKWVDKGARIVIALRALVLTKDRWSQFWKKVNQYGFPVAA